MNSGKIRPYGRDRIALHLAADHPACDELREAALFVSTYSRAGRVIAFDFAFPKSEAERLREIAQAGD